MQPVVQVVGSGAIGGGTTVVLALSQGLMARGVPVVIISDRGSYLIDAARQSGIETVELDFGQRRDTPGLAMRLSHALRYLQPSMVHAHGARAGLPVALIPLSIRGPFAYTVHGFHYPGKPAATRFFAKAVERFCAHRSAVTVFVSKYDRNLALNDGVMVRGSRHTVIHNGGSAGPPVSPAPGPGFDIAFLGRLHPQKDPLGLADILLALRPLQPTIGIIGSGPCEAALKERLEQAGISHQVRFLGARPADEARALLARARCLILPSISEGLPVAVIEAMHLGVPAVASRVGGVGELIIDGETGILVRPGDYAGYADGLRRLLTVEADRAAMAQAARQRAAEAFSLDRMLGRHMALYRHVSQPRRAGEAGLIQPEWADA